jgi:hypothetical protein
MTGEVRAEFCVTAGSVSSYYPDLNGKIKCVVDIIDKYACLLHFPSKFWDAMSPSPSALCGRFR